MELDENENKNINNILSRNDSVGFSDFRCNEGVPFQWEMQPGIPKHPQQQQNIIPPLTPPPAILSSNLPWPSISDHSQFSKPSSSSSSSSSNWSTRFRFWKRKAIVILIKKQTRRSKNVVREGSQEYGDSFDAFAGVKSLSDRESVAMSLPFDSSLSSSSSSRSQSPIRGIYGKPLSCFPVYVSKFHVSFARRD
ncbi:uncharacterized protein LOC114744863 [Neltuma alba]|uniref:uncharacterized protein LOC114744863 n=1 Tax=Neltuma alba TaxID=207710 RepID=UPI0010A3981B|nr:uncharacterized protein LOC114744863 [Prosopis alba]